MCCCRHVCGSSLVLSMTKRKKVLMSPNILNNSVCSRGPKTSQNKLHQHMTRHGSWLLAHEAQLHCIIRCFKDSACRSTEGHVTSSSLETGSRQVPFNQHETCSRHVFVWLHTASSSNRSDSLNFGALGHPPDHSRLFSCYSEEFYLVDVLLSRIQPHAEQPPGHKYGPRCEC